MYQTDYDPSDIGSPEDECAGCSGYSWATGICADCRAKMDAEAQAEQRFGAALEAVGVAARRVWAAADLPPGRGETDEERAVRVREWSESRVEATRALRRLAWLLGLESR